MRRIPMQMLMTAVSLGALAAPAWAQDSTPKTGSTGQAALPLTAAGPALSSEAVPPAEQDTGQIKEIIVSARRRNETIQQTPIAITAISPSQLEAKGTLNIGDLQGQAPNVIITQQSSGTAAANISIRGLAFADVEKSFDPTVAVVVDGVFIGTSTGQFLDFFDIGSLEILRGPQGTLFGRNTIGGVINITRSRPTGEWGGKFQASYGSYDTWSAKGVLNAPIVDGVLAAKGFYMHSQSDGFYRNAIRGGRDGGYNNENFGLSLLFTPSPDFDALLTVEKQVQDAEVTNANIAKTGEVFCTIEPANECNRNTTDQVYTVFTSPASSHYSSPAGTLQMNLNAGPIKLTSITGYRKSNEGQTQDFDASSADLYYTNRTQRFHQFSQELRGAGKFFDGFDYVIGGFYYSSYYHLVQNTRLFGGPLPPQIATGHAKSYAAFGDFDWAFADKFRLSFGGRYTHDKKSFNNFLAVPLGTPSASFNKFTPKVGVDYRPNSDVMFYASWSRGYRSGGFSNRAQTAFSTNTPYGPETVDSYEVGTKLSLLDHKLLFNVAAFYADYKNLQQNTTIPAPPPAPGNETIVTNVGKARIKGVEADLTARPTPNLRLTGGLSYLDSHFKGFITQSGATTYDYSDVHLIYAPKWTGSANADYKIPTTFGEGHLNVGYRYLSRYDQQISTGPTVVQSNGVVRVLSNDPRVRTNIQGLLDASASLQFGLIGKKARVTVYGRNLTDNRGTNTAFTVAGLWSFAAAREPRTFGVQLDLEY